MKKFFVIISLMFAVLLCSAQTKTITIPQMSDGVSYGLYSGTAADTLTTNMDSIQYVFPLSAHNLYKVTAGVSLYKRSANDTLIKVSVWGKNFGDESYTKFYQVNSANVTGTSTAPTQISATYGTAVMYRYIRVILQIAGQKSTGVRVKSIELKYWIQ